MLGLASAVRTACSTAAETVSRVVVTGTGRSVTAPIVLELLYDLAAVTPPPPTASQYPGYPLVRRPQAIAAVFFAGWPLLLTIALAAYLMLEVARTEHELTVVADFDVPLTKSLGQIDDAGLRRRLAFERWFGALNAAEIPNAKA